MLTAFRRFEIYFVTIILNIILGFLLLYVFIPKVINLDVSQLNFSHEFFAFSLVVLLIKYLHELFIFEERAKMLVNFIDNNGHIGTPTLFLFCMNKIFVPIVTFILIKYVLYAPSTSEASLQSEVAICIFVALIFAMLFAFVDWWFLPIFLIKYTENTGNQLNSIRKAVRIWKVISLITIIILVLISFLQYSIRNFDILRYLIGIIFIGQTVFDYAFNKKYFFYPGKLEGSV